MTRKTPEQLRSFRTWGAADLRSFGHRSRTKQMGYDEADWKGKPVIGVLNTWSDLNQCHQHFRVRAEEVKRGVWQAGGFPVEIPALALPEQYMKPTSMFYRNLLAIEVEEIARGQPLDGLVLMGGCDKTTPAMLMGAISANLPAIFMPAGPMLRGNWNGNTLGSGSDTWKYWDELRAGTITQGDWQEIENGIARSWGTCMTMGTASTMTVAVEAMGFSLPGASSDPRTRQQPRPDGQRLWPADRGHGVGGSDTRSAMLTPGSIDNAVRVAMALGGSTNSVVHLIAMARRAGVPLDLDRFDELSRTSPLIANIRPSGKYLMEDFYYAGGSRALMGALGDLLDLSAATVNGHTLGENIEGAKVLNPDVILPRDQPIEGRGRRRGAARQPGPGWRGDQTLGGRPGAWPGTPARPSCSTDYNDMAVPHRRTGAGRDRRTACWCCAAAGPIGAPGMPEWGMLPIPKKILQQGVRDMVRISDARMSGTSPTAPACCTWRRRVRSAGRWRWCGPAT